MLDRARATGVFLQYAGRYDAAETRIALKIEHTLRVAEHAQRIAASLGMAGADADLAWLLGLLHDIGRFEQVRRFGTFIDADSVDHAALGADILFRDGWIGAFPAEGLPEGWKALCETAIRAHNRLTLPEGLNARERTFCDLLRDADKADIFRVIAEVPYEARASRGRADSAEAAGPEVMACVYGHRCVPKPVIHTRFEGRLSHCCLAFELVYEETRRIVREQGYLRAMLSETDGEGRPAWSEGALAQLRATRAELERAWGMPV